MSSNDGYGGLYSIDSDLNYSKKEKKNNDILDRVLAQHWTWTATSNIILMISLGG